MLFSKFAAFYGHIWRSQFKDGEAFFVFVQKEWQEGLKDFNDGTLEKAIVKCREFYELPPTLPQLIRCCKEIKKQELAFVKEPESARSTIEVVESHLRQCYEKLRK